MSAGPNSRAGAIAALAGSLALGCASTTLAPPLGPAERAELARTRFERALCVEAHPVAAFSAELTRVLRASALFPSVEPCESAEGAQAELLASIDGHGFTTPVIPFWTALSLGLIPTHAEEEFGFRIVLRRRHARAPAEAVTIETRYRTRTTLGWVALLLNRSSDRTSGAAHDHARHREWIAWRIASHAAHIRSL
jgi:hypothetical protein